MENTTLLFNDEMENIIDAMDLSRGSLPWKNLSVSIGL